MCGDVRVCLWALVHGRCLLLCVVLVSGTDHKYHQTRAEQGNCANRDPAGKLEDCPPWEV